MIICSKALYRELKRNHRAYRRHLTRIRLQLAIYFCLHRAKSGRKHGIMRAVVASLWHKAQENSAGWIVAPKWHPNFAQNARVIRKIALKVDRTATYRGMKKVFRL